MIDFPSSPAIGQVFSAGGKSWVFNGTAWDLRISNVSPGIALSGQKGTYAALPTTGLSDGDAYFVSADGQIYVYDSGAFPAQGSGIQVTRPTTGFFHAYSVTNQVFPATNATDKLVLDTVVENSIGTWNPATNTLTVAAAGLYSITFTRQVPSAATFAEPRVYINGTAPTVPIPAGSQYYAGTFSNVRLNAGDTIDVRAYHPAAATIMVPSNGGLRIIGPL